MADTTLVMQDAVEKCLQHVREGGIPFVGVVVKNGKKLSGFATNRVSEAGDPTAHAEIVAMREAMQTYGEDILAGAELFATGEPCGMCYQFALAHGIKTIYVAANRYSAAEWGFDYLRSYLMYRVTDDVLSGVVQYVDVDDAAGPFKEFARKRKY